MNEVHIEKEITNLLTKLTIDEKISLLSKHTGFSSKPIERLGIPEFKMADGPNGVRRGHNTYFPATVGLAASWNRDLIYEYGKALGEETKAKGVNCILGPGLNIHRTPLGGRNFEYFTEDPYLNSEVVVPYVQGVQSNNIAACLKHFVANNSEVRRRWSNSIVDERALHEIYLKGFKAGIERGNAWVIMGSYNKVNGKYVYERKDYVNDLLRETWGFKGFMVSDWFATHACKEPEKCIKAGLSLEMPKDFCFNPEATKESFAKNKFTEAELDKNLCAFLRVLFYTKQLGTEKSQTSEQKKKIKTASTKEHLQLARKIIHEGTVLLKNDTSLLPIKYEGKVKKICVTGPLANYKPFTWALGGSSGVHPPSYTTPLKAIRRKIIEIDIKDGFKFELVNNPKKADVVIYITGKTHWAYNDFEGTDKPKMELLNSRIKKIKKIAGNNKNIIMVLRNGGPTEMSEWIDSIPTILQVWQPHQEAGQAIAEMLFGEATPSGKLPTTFPKTLKDSAAHKDSETYPDFKYGFSDLIKHEGLYVKSQNKKGKAKYFDIKYKEGIYVGYRQFDKDNIDPQFPFGYGLSYTKFELNNVKLSKSEIIEGEDIELSVSVKNIGNIVGAETVQVYASDLTNSIDRPPQELVGFEKVHLNPGEEKTATLKIRAEDLQYYDVSTHDWVLPKGQFSLKIGTSSREIKFEEILTTK